MTVTHLLTDVGNAALWVSAAAIMIWICQYSLLAPWWRHGIGITLVGLALALLAIYVPPLIALLDPHFRFIHTTWYLCLAVTIIVASAAFVITRIVLWEKLRRQRQDTGQPVLPIQMSEHIRELEAENQHLRERLAEALGDTA